MTVHTFGYCRVSTSHQTLDQQFDALEAAGVPEKNIFKDVQSGATWDRKGLEDLKSHVRAGDVVIVTALDRLGRSTLEMLTLINWFIEQQIVLRSLREGIDFSTATGRMMAGIFSALAEYERSLMLERTQSAREAAKARGRQVGRPKVITDKQVQSARVLIAGGASLRESAQTLGLSVSTLHRALAAPAGS